MKRIAIIGGGISGLSAAFALETEQRNGAPLSYVLYESTPRLGGVLLTERVDGCLIEAGPDSFLTEKPWAADLCRELGLGHQLIGSNDAQRNTCIVRKDRLLPIPDGLMFMVPTKITSTVLSPLFSLNTKLRMAREWFLKPHPVDGDESVATFVARHYGQELVDSVADPMLSGIYGGEATELSMRAVLPRFLEMEEKYGSLGRALIASRKKAPAGSPKPALFTTLKDGMQRMSDAILARLSSQALRPNTPVLAMQPQSGGWSVAAVEGASHFDAVILATPAPAAGRLLASSSPQLASELAGIQCSPSLTVSLGFDQSVRTSLPPGFGFLVPHNEGKRMLAATFVHNKFEHRVPEDRAVIRCFLGGTRDEHVMQLSDDEIIRIVRAELRQILGLAAAPRFVRVHRWNDAMAQYNVGHLDRIDRIEKFCASLPALALAGNAYRGIGVPDCVRSGREAASRVLNRLGLGQPAAART